MTRNESRERQLALVAASYDAAPAELTDLVAPDGSFDPDDQWRPVRLTGEYLTSDTLLARNRAHGGTAAFEVLVPFRTWRYTTTGEASDTLTTALNQNIPLRWSVAHLYQVLLNKEEHASRIDFMTTLAGYVHWRLTGEKVLGVGDASGMFPVAADGRSFDTERLATFDELAKGTALSRPGQHHARDSAGR